MPRILQRIDEVWIDVVRRCQSRLPWFPDVFIEVDCSFRVKPRHFAAVSTDGPVILFVCPELEKQPLTRIRGILAHEAGHIAYDLGLVGEKDLQGISLMDSERQADLAAWFATGWIIKYDRDLVQKAGPGSRGDWPRPINLR